MSVRELRLDRVVADWFDRIDGHIALPNLKHLLPGAMTADLGRRGVDAQELAGQAEDESVAELNLQNAGNLMQNNAGGNEHRGL